MSPLSRPHGAALVALALGVLAAPASAVEVRVTVEQGRALFVSDHGIQAVTRSRGVLVYDGAAQLELAPGSRARIAWPGRCSVDLVGPASLGWLVETPGEPLRLDLAALRGAELEVRGGSVRADLPGAWRLGLGEGALALTGLPSGGVEVRHQAGRPAVASWVGDRAFAPAPLQVWPGERVRLSGPPLVSARADTSHSAPGWSTWSWPWGDRDLAGAPVNPPGRSRDATRSALTTEPSVVQVQIEPGEAPVAPWRRWDWPWQPAQGAPETHGPGSPADGGSGPGSLDSPEGHGPEESPAVLVDSPGAWAWPWPDSEGPAPGPGSHGVPDPGIADGVDPSAVGATPRNDHEGGQGGSSQGRDGSLPGTETVQPTSPGIDSEQPTSPAIDSEQHSSPADPEPVVPRDPTARGPEPGPGAEAESVPSEGVGQRGAPGATLPGTPTPADGGHEAVVAPAPPGPGPAEPTAPGAPGHRPELWRGLGAEALDRRATCVLQRGIPFELSELPDGGRELRVPADAPEPLWYFGPSLDLRLFPGATLFLEADGTIRYHTGEVRVLQGHHERRFQATPEGTR